MNPEQPMESFALEELHESNSVPCLYNFFIVISFKQGYQNQIITLILLF
jgi:hypothetical protein